MQFDKFTITLISPALLSAADTRNADPNGLRGSSLRGVWRFWARALWRGLKTDLSLDCLKTLENGIFGNTGNRAFRMKITDVSNPPSDPNYKVRALPHKPVQKSPPIGAIEEGSAFTITLYWPLRWDENRKKTLASIILLWAMLGGVGQRSRRGFGSVRLHGGTGVFDLKNLLAYDHSEVPKQFSNPEELLDFIKQSICKIAEIQTAYMTSMGITPVFNDVTQALSHDETFRQMFTLKSLHQIAAGNDFPMHLFGPDHLKNEDKAGILYVTHGNGIGEKEEHGSGGNPRLASPICIRLHKGKNGYIPLAVISYRKGPNTFSDEFNDWLKKMGVKALGKKDAHGGQDGPSSPVDWSVKSGIRPQAPKDSKKCIDPDWARKFQATRDLKKIIENIRAIKGVDEAIPDMGTYEKSGGRSTPPLFEAPEAMTFLAAARDGRVKMSLKLTCKTETQWYYVFNEIRKFVQ